ncbi:hypothetical protein CALCODRAFT_440577 [Calocera cornea HHB12733]|uniref:Uncharacterized protein n=1 Tax=Calocera cornea HHB12733 TaxID=1353952 RepID=A0A165DMT4_9BASI|nr:hypothetical protein CALCODRAFT_440577 [Calocera cornea HHB12733]
MHSNLLDTYGSPYGPFQNDVEWDLAWNLVRSGLSNKWIDSLLKSPLLRDRPSPTFINAVQLKRLLDEHLPPAPRFQVTQIEVEGASGMDSETLELWGRDPLDCVRELLGDPLLNGHIDYAPRRDYVDGSCSERLYSEYATGNHMWTTQASRLRY